MKLQFALIALLLAPTAALAQDTSAEAEPAAEPTATEAAADETKPTETPADETKPAEAPADETKTAETPADETKPAEAPADETKPAEASAETPTETPTEIPAETAAEPATDGVAATVAVGDESEIQRTGLYLGFGLAWAVSNLAEEGMSPMSGDFWVRMGYAITNQILVGGEFALLGNFNAWEEQEVIGAMMSSVMATSMYFPLADIPFSIGAGLGWGSNLRAQRLADSSDDNPLAHGNGDDGLSFMLSAGYDFGAGPGANFGVRLRWDGAYLADAGMVSNIGLGVALNFY